MQMWTKIVGVTVLAPVLVLGGFTAAGAVAGGHRAAVRQPVRAAAVSSINTSREAGLVSITPCRIVDTRQAVGVIRNGVTRSYYVGGTTGFAPQGGKSGGCGIPVGATAIAATVTAVSPTGGGFLRAWPANQSEPSATLLNYAARVASGTGATVAVDPATTRSLKVKNYGGPTQLVVDVSGYYLPPIQADINGNGSILEATSRVLSVGHGATGQYQVAINRTVGNQCSVQVTAANINLVATGFALNGSVFVDITRVTSGALTDAEFNLTVTC